jgi:hypothetical protein
MYETNGKARAWLEKNGFTDIHFFPHTRFSKDAYFKGLGWDGLCSCGKLLTLFQTKTNRGCTKKTKEQMLIASRESGVVLVWINAKTRKGLDITLISGNGVEQLNSKEKKI